MSMKFSFINFVCIEHILLQQAQIAKNLALVEYFVEYYGFLCVRGQNRSTAWTLIRRNILKGILKSTFDRKG